MKRSDVLRRAFLPLGLVLMSLVLGCSTDSTPLASGELALAEDGRSYLSFSAEGQQRAGKIAAVPAEGVVVSDFIKADKGGWLKFQDKNQPGNDDDLKVELMVGANALESDVTITMTVYGNTLSDLVVAFDPGGLIFLEDALLEIWLGEYLVDIDPDSIVVHHEYSDGTVEEAVIFSAEYSPPAFKILVAVPGFSRYTLGD